MSEQAPNLEQEVTQPAVEEFAGRAVAGEEVAHANSTPTAAAQNSAPETGVSGVATPGPHIMEAFRFAKSGAALPGPEDQQ